MLMTTIRRLQHERGTIRQPKSSAALLTAITSQTTDRRRPPSKTKDASEPTESVALPKQIQVENQARAEE